MQVFKYAGITKDPDELLELREKYRAKDALYLNDGVYLIDPEFINPSMMFATSSLLTIRILSGPSSTLMDANHLEFCVWMQTGAQTYRAYNGTKYFDFTADNYLDLSRYHLIFTPSHSQVKLNASSLPGGTLNLSLDEILPIYIRGLDITCNNALNSYLQTTLFPRHWWIDCMMPTKSRDAIFILLYRLIKQMMQRVFRISRALKIPIGNLLDGTYREMLTDSMMSRMSLRYESPEIPVPKQYLFPIKTNTCYDARLTSPIYIYSVCDWMEHNIGPSRGYSEADFAIAVLLNIGPSSMVGAMSVNDNVCTSQIIATATELDLSPLAVVATGSGMFGRFDSDGWLMHIETRTRFQTRMVGGGQMYNSLQYVTDDLKLMVDNHFVDNVILVNWDKYSYERGNLTSDGQVVPISSGSGENDKEEKRPVRLMEQHDFYQYMTMVREQADVVTSVDTEMW